MLADLDGNLIFLLIAAVIGLINWFTKKAETPEQKESPPKTGQPGTLRPPPSANSEEERMRKFLEALGVPAGQAPPPVKRREPQPVTPRPLPRLEPKPPFVAGPLPLPRLPRTKPRPAAPVPPPLPPREEVSQDQRPAPTLPVEKLHLPTLETPEVKELVTTSSTISATPNQHLAPQDDDAYSIAPETSTQARSEGIRALLSSPASLRNAVLLREVLGPPRGLPSIGALPTFP